MTVVNVRLSKDDVEQQLDAAGVPGLVGTIEPGSAWFDTNGDLVVEVIIDIEGADT